MNIDFLITKFGFTKVKSVYDSLDLLYLQKVNKRLKVLFNILFSKKSKLMIKLMVKNHTEFNAFLRFYKKKYY